nr:invasion associated locus B family protein [uncultured Gellertiella sp.]
MTSLLRAVLAALLLVSASALAAAGSSAAQAPKPDSLIEIYGAWQISCATRDGKTRCVMVENLSDEKSNQRLLSLELHPVAHGGLDGVAIMPFGLDLASGLGFMRDQKQLLARRPFKACLSQGCVADIALSADEIDSIGDTCACGLKAVTFKEGKEIAFPLKMQGFEAAVRRLRALAAGQ